MPSAQGAPFVLKLLAGAAIGVGFTLLSALSRAETFINVVLVGFVRLLTTGVELMAEDAIAVP